jgi:hypothetical protein
MTHRATRCLTAAILALSAGLAFGQIATPPKSEARPHDVALTDTLPISGTELANVYQAVGPQRINGNLRRPLVDYSVRNGAILHRVSFFEGGLVYVHMKEAMTDIQKKLLLPDDAAKGYLARFSTARLNEIPADMFAFSSLGKRKGTLRIYSGDRFVERSFDPSVVQPKAFSDLIMPLEDFLQTISDASRIANRITGYQPHVGDHLVGDDQSTYEVVGIFGDDSVLELRRDNQPTTIYVAKKDLHNYFIGSRKAPLR